MSRSQIRGTQIKDDSITGDDVDESTLILNTLRDADNDTKIQVEESADEDKIRFDISGNEIARIESSGVFVTGSFQITPGHNSGIIFNKSEDELNFIQFKNSDDGSSYNASFAYQPAEHIYISPGRGADFYIQSRTNSGADPWTFPFRIMDDGTAKFEKRQSDSSISVADLSEDVTFWVSGSTDGNYNAVFGGNVVMSSSLSVGGELYVSQYIRHTGDTNTHINFTDDQIVLKAGNISMVKMEEKTSAPHEVTINDGSNNIDFVVKGNGSGAGNPGVKFDASTNRLGVNGVGTPDKALHVGGSMKLDGSQSTIFFADGADEKAEIGINSSDNILIENKTTNKHIVFKVNDQGVVKEGFRLDGAVPEVVVNQASDSLVDFRVESDNQTHMLFVDGSQDRIGINTQQPVCELDVNGTVRTKAFGVNVRDVNSTSSVQDTDYCLRFIQMSPITITLPAKASSAGRVLVFKDALGNAASNNITIDGDGSDQIDGAATYIINNNKEAITLTCDGINGWMITSRVIP